MTAERADIGCDGPTIARETVKMMFEVSAIHVNAAKPFIFTSGWASPVYVDCRKLISYPRVRSALTAFAATTICRNVGYESIDCVAGGETAGIPFAAWISDRLMLPMLYVRKKAKGFGRNVEIEGNVVPGNRTLLVEDLATDGGSKVQFCDTLRRAGLTVEHCFVIFYYDIFPRATLEETDVTLHYLATWWDILDYARTSGRYDPATVAEIERYLHEPAKWSLEHGGKAEFARKTE